MSAPSTSPTRDSANSSPKKRSHSSAPQAPSSYFTFPVSYAVGGILRRLSSDVPSRSSPKRTPKQEMYTPPVRKLSPFQPPPLTPLTLSGWRFTTKENARLLTRALAEEIRLLVPPRLQLEEEWKLLFSLEQDGVSLSTLYKKCEDYRGKRGGYVLVIRDGMGGVSDSFGNLPWARADSYIGTDLRSLFKRRITSTTTFLRHWRVLSMAVLDSPSDT